MAAAYDDMEITAKFIFRIRNEPTFGPNRDIQVELPVVKNDYGEDVVLRSLVT